MVQKLSNVDEKGVNFDMQSYIPIIQRIGKNIGSKTKVLRFLGLPDPDPLVRGTDPDPSIIKQK